MASEGAAGPHARQRGSAGHVSADSQTATSCCGRRSGTSAADATRNASVHAAAKPSDTLYTQQHLPWSQKLGKHVVQTRRRSHNMIKAHVLCRRCALSSITNHCKDTVDEFSGQSLLVLPGSLFETLPCVDHR